MEIEVNIELFNVLESREIEHTDSFQVLIFGFISYILRICCVLSRVIRFSNPFLELSFCNGKKTRQEGQVPGGVGIWGGARDRGQGA